MTGSFAMNGVRWDVMGADAGSTALIDRTGTATVATTDPQTGTIRISDGIGGGMLERVMLHEAAHAALVSFGLLDGLHGLARPGFEIEAEEWACNFLADYGIDVFRAAYGMLGSRILDLMDYSTGGEVLVK